MAPHKLTRKQLANRRAKRAEREAASNLQNDDQLLNFAQWCAVNQFSPATGNRILASGEGPPVVRPSLRDRRIRVGDNRRWQESRIRSA